MDNDHPSSIQKSRLFSMTGSKKYLWSLPRLSSSQTSSFTFAKTSSSLVCGEGLSISPKTHSCYEGHGPFHWQRALHPHESFKKSCLLQEIQPLVWYSGDSCKCCTSQFMGLPIGKIHGNTVQATSWDF